uniref:Putative ovule protein n=1 Tax=Solanum chacoense TaxID=4108 RepID=A0A0V0GFQ9_SOLCH
MDFLAKKVMKQIRNITQSLIMLNPMYLDYFMPHLFSMMIPIIMMKTKFKLGIISTIEVTILL